MVNEGIEIAKAELVARLGSWMQSQSMDELQNDIIEFGGEFERRYGLENSFFIHQLEDLCEIIYSVGIGEDTVASVYSKIAGLLNALEISAGTERFLSITTMIKDETPYMKEWLEYHLMMGVEHFYIYDNESTDGLVELLQPYIERGLVTHEMVYGKNQHYPTLYKATQDYQFATKYMAIIDSDEFLVPSTDKSLTDTIAYIFSKYTYAGGIGVNWRIYGSSFHDTKPDGLVIENYTYRQSSLGKAYLGNSSNLADNAHIKTICNPRTVSSCQSPHFMDYKKGFYQISEYGTIFNGPFFAEGRCDLLRVNHYYTKSKEEYFARRRRGEQSGHTFDDEKISRLYDEYDSFCNEYKDNIMEKYVDELKKRML